MPLSGHFTVNGSNYTWECLVVFMNFFKYAG